MRELPPSVLADLLDRGFNGFVSGDVASVVRELADREELRELSARYAFLVSQKRSAAELFTDDGGFLFRRPDGEAQEARGREALDAIFADILRPPNHNLPTVHNHIFSIDGDIATGVCWIELHAAKDGEEWIGSGYYEDRFRLLRGSVPPRGRALEVRPAGFDAGEMGKDAMTRRRAVSRKAVIACLSLAAFGLLSLSTQSAAREADVSGPAAGPPSSTSMNCERIPVNDPGQRQDEIVGQPPRISPLNPEDMGAEAQVIADRIRAAAGSAATGEVPEMVSTLLRHPALYARHVALGTELLGNGALPPRHRELAVLRTGWLLGAPYEWGEHVAIGKRAGLTTEEIERIKQGSDAQGWSMEDRAIIRAAEELRGNVMISDRTWSELETFLDERQLIELPYLIGNYTKVAYLQNALRLRLRSDNRGLHAR